MELSETWNITYSLVFPLTIPYTTSVLLLATCFSSFTNALTGIFPQILTHARRVDTRRSFQMFERLGTRLSLIPHFRSETRVPLHLENETAGEAFRHLLPNDSTCSAYHSRLQKMLQARANFKQINDAWQADGEEHKISKQDDDLQLLGEVKTAKKELFDMNAHPADTLSLKLRVAMLNADQRRIFGRVKDHLLHQQQHEADECCSHVCQRCWWNK